METRMDARTHTQNRQLCHTKQRVSRKARTQTSPEPRRGCKQIGLRAGRRLTLCYSQADTIVKEGHIDETVRAIPPQRSVLDDQEAEPTRPPQESDAQASSSGNNEASTSSPRQGYQNNYRPAYPSRRPRYDGPKSDRGTYDGPRSDRSKRRTDFILKRMEASTPSQKAAERVENFPFKRGDLVVGTVIGGSNGWRIALDYDQGLLGFCPLQELPHTLKDQYKQTPNFAETIVGTRREFVILDIPHDMEYNGKGPKLSARYPDTGVIWQRAMQMKEVCQEECDVITATMTTSNNGGLLGFMDGLPLFVPWSYLPRLNLGINSKEEMMHHFMGKDCILSIQDVNREHNRFVGNMIEAMNNNAYSRLSIGDLVWGTVNSVVHYGAFVTLDDYPSVRSLIHIASISQTRVGQTEDIFQAKDRVRCAVIGIDQEARQLSLSTAELENFPGEMLENKAAVFENAEEAIQDYLAFVEEQRKAGFPQEKPQTKRSRDDLQW